MLDPTRWAIHINRYRNLFKTNSVSGVHLYFIWLPRETWKLFRPNLNGGPRAKRPQSPLLCWSTSSPPSRIFINCATRREVQPLSIIISHSVFLSVEINRTSICPLLRIPTLPANTYIYYTGWSAPIWGLPLFLSTCSEYIELLWSYLRVQETSLLCKVEKTQSQRSLKNQKSRHFLCPACLCVCWCVFILREA